MKQILILLFLLAAVTDQAQQISSLPRATNSSPLDLLLINKKVGSFYQPYGISVSNFWSSTDITPVSTYAQLSNALYSAQNNSEIWLVSSVTLTPIDFSSNNVSALRLWSKTNVILRGIGFPTIGGTGGVFQGDLLTVEKCNACQIIGINFTNWTRTMPAGPGGNWAAINFTDTNGVNPNINCKVLGCGFNMVGHAISHLDGDKTTRGVEIAGSYFEQVGTVNFGGVGDGACVSGIGSYWNIHHNFVTNCVRGFEIQNSVTTTPCVGAMITDNEGDTISDFWMAQITDSGDSTKFKDIHWERNVVRNCVAVAPGIGEIAEFWGGENCVVRQNQAFNCTQGMSFGSGTAANMIDWIVENNTINGCYPGGLIGAIQFWKNSGSGVISNILIRANSINDVYGPGIYCAGDRIRVIGNSIYQASLAVVCGAIQFDNVATVNSRNGIIEHNEIVRGYLQPGSSTWRLDYGVWINTGVSNMVVRNNDIWGAETNVFDQGTNNVISGSTGGGTNMVKTFFWGGGGMQTKTVTANYTATDDDDVVLVNGTTLTITLPDARPRCGRRFTVKLIANSTGSLTGTASQTFDGLTTTNLTAQWKSITVVSDCANWQVVGADR